MEESIANYFFAMEKRREYLLIVFVFVDYGRCVLFL